MLKTVDIDDLLTKKENQTLKDGVKDGVKEHVDIQQIIVELLNNNNSLSAMDLAQKTGMGFRTVQRYLSQLQRKNLIKRVGGRKTVVEQTDYE